MNLTKKLVYDEKGKPIEVIIPYEQFKELEEILGLDLEPEVKDHLKKAKIEKELNEDNYVDLDEL